MEGVEPMAEARLVAEEEEEASLGMGYAEVMEGEGEGDGEGVRVEGKAGRAEAEGRWAEEERADKGQVAAPRALEEGVVVVGEREGGGGRLSTVGGGSRGLWVGWCGAGGGGAGRGWLLWRR